MGHGCHTCIQCDVQSANRSCAGVFEIEAAWPSPHTLGRHVERGLGGCVDELLHCSCWAGAWQENTLCMTGKQNRKEWPKKGMKIIFISLENKCIVLIPHTQKTHSGLCWFDFLEMLSHRFFAAELSLTLRTFITDVLQ